jgi:hypothetical protein
MPPPDTAAPRVEDESCPLRDRRRFGVGVPQNDTRCLPAEANTMVLLNSNLSRAGTAHAPLSKPHAEESDGRHLQA